ncbi:uncharacterized protein DAT39_018678, partial [Clarias magur]
MTTNIPGNIGQIISPGPWHEYCVNNMGLPRQHLSNNCGIFVLMYSLSFAIAGDFDFTEIGLLKYPGYQIAFSVW